MDVAYWYVHSTAFVLVLTLKWRENVMNRNIVVYYKRSLLAKIEIRSM